ncbi:MAG TPA: protoporphyrinogen oxidase [Candidatus Obscuribacterales bacterium]
MDSGGSLGGPAVIVIGGGISGLAAAHRLTSLKKESKKNYSVLLLEASSRLGGVIKTHRQADCLIEDGPDAFLTAKPWALNLLKELGLAEHIISTNEAHRRAFVARGRYLVPLPEGFRLLAPADLLSFARSPLFSLGGKLRMLLDLALPRHPLLIDGDGNMRSDFDESLSSFVARRLGREALDRVAEAMVAGIYTADPTRLSVRATIPQFLEWEAKCGSVIRGLKSQKKTGPYATGIAAKEAGAGVRYSMFASLDEGLELMVTSLEKHIDRVRLNAKVRQLSFEAANKKWRLQLEEGETLTADGIVAAVPAYAAAHLLKNVSGELSQALERIEYASSCVINFIFDRRQIAHDLDGFGFVVPAREKKGIIAGGFSSVKFKGRAPDNKVVLRAFLGGALQNELLSHSDDKLIERALNDLDFYLGISGQPEYVRLVRWPRSMAQYAVGHLSLVSQIESLARELPGLYLSGSAYRGVGIPDCIRAGQDAAERSAADMDFRYH